MHIDASSACDDGNPCTADTCDPKAGCGHTATPGPCDDGLKCTQDDSCINGLCNSSTPTNCDDGNVCTNDKCSENNANGCYHETVPQSYGMACGPTSACILSGCVNWSEEHVAIPGGPFIKGCTSAVGSAACDANPDSKNTVTVGDFQIDRTEVTVAAYAACVKAGGCTTPVVYAPGGPSCTWSPNFITSNSPGTRPINCLTFKQSQDYCTWRGQRLPSDAEWEKAARGGCEFYLGKDCATAEPVYPWGNDPATCLLAIMTGGIYKADVGCQGNWPYPVDSRPNGDSPYGLHDTVGNVAERVQDCSHDLPLGAGPKDGSAWVAGCTGAIDYLQRVTRGGHYASTAASADLNAWQGTTTLDSATLATVGFRCAKSGLN